MRPVVEPVQRLEQQRPALVHRHAVGLPAAAAARAPRAATSRARARQQLVEPLPQQRRQAGRVAVRRNRQRDAVAPDDAAQKRGRVRRIVHRVDEDPPLFGRLPPPRGSRPASPPRRPATRRRDRRARTRDARSCTRTRAGDRPSICRRPDGATTRTSAPAASSCCSLAAATGPAADEHDTRGRRGSGTAAASSRKKARKALMPSGPLGLWSLCSFELECVDSAMRPDRWLGGSTEPNNSSRHAHDH